MWLRETDTDLSKNMAALCVTKKCVCLHYMPSLEGKHLVYG
jgi:hypothetical protein